MQIRVPFNVFFKEGQEAQLLEEYQEIKERLHIIAEDMALFCHSQGYKFIITDILSDCAEDIRLNRVSKSHSEGRAFDFRIHGWPKEFLDTFERRFEAIYKEVAAVSKTTGLKNLILYHTTKNGLHGHCQIRPGL